MSVPVGGKKFVDILIGFEPLLFPESLNWIGIHLGILADEDEGMIHCLGDQDAVEWIAVMER
jgi:hypothetical protein